MAYDKDQIIGCIIGNYDTTNSKKAYIAMIVVLKEYRRLKIGHKLFDEFYKRVEKHVDKIVL
jgi:ribosomal protein S18 acetylase RimI-like enzyme